MGWAAGMTPSDRAQRPLPCTDVVTGHTRVMAWLMGEEAATPALRSRQYSEGGSRHIWHQGSKRRASMSSRG